MNFKSSRVSDDPNAGHWMWGRGGHPHGDHEFSISYVDDGLVETRYKMPPPINEMLRLQRDHGKQDAQREIKAEIGCFNNKEKGGCPLEKE